MAGPMPMNRLLQGDVGSGKTVVAVYAMLLAVAHGYQAALMAPTEVLARQHALTLDRMLAASHVRRAQLTGGLTTAQRTALLQLIAAGEVDLVVGTQAIIQEDVSFAKLGLVVIDEQHKFGVRQRAVLKGKAGAAAKGTVPFSSNENRDSPQNENRGVEGDSPIFVERKSGQSPDPHYLVMTATPIPRSVTMTLFGDLDVSTLRDSPPGRQKVNTYLANDQQRAKWWEFFRRKLREGRQGFVDHAAGRGIGSGRVGQPGRDLRAAGQRRVGGVSAWAAARPHGPGEKDAVMADFRRGEIQVLVSTSVVEVGVDVPNATLMTIEGGHRFGLAQLHQLRGRISRGKFPGFCCVFGDPQTEESRRTAQGVRRLDRRLRAGRNRLPAPRAGRRFRHQATRSAAAADCRSAPRSSAAGGGPPRRPRLVAADPGLASEATRRLRRMMLVRYGKALDLGDVG